MEQSIGTSDLPAIWQSATFVISLNQQNTKSIGLLIRIQGGFRMKNKTKWITGILVAALLMMTGLTGCGNSGSASEGAEPAADGIGTHHVNIDIADYGTVELELDGDTAPITVQNFMDLADSGFYDGLTFHRIMDGFMIQGGDPNGDGTGGSEQTIKGEFSSNGVANDISHEKGVISMARSQDPDSASSQFFIVVADSDFLDGQYAAFGHVTSGQEIVDKIAKDAQPLDDNGTIAKEDQPVIEKVTVVD